MIYNKAVCSSSFVPYNALPSREHPVADNNNNNNNNMGFLSHQKARLTRIIRVAGNSSRSFHHDCEVHLYFEINILRLPSTPPTYDALTRILASAMQTANYIHFTDQEHSHKHEKKKQ